MRNIGLLPLCALSARGGGGDDTYYLYRSTILGGGGERIHIAAFDAKEGRGYNEENCMIVRGLMERQPGVQVGYWCAQLKP